MAKLIADFFLSQIENIYNKVLNTKYLYQILNKYILFISGNFKYQEEIVTSFEK